MDPAIETHIQNLLQKNHQKEAVVFALHQVRIFAVPAIAQYQQQILCL
jgi:hypothetical protein